MMVKLVCIKYFFISCLILFLIAYIDGLVQERCNSIANALELRLPCINPSIYVMAFILNHWSSSALLNWPNDYLPYHHCLHEYDWDQKYTWGPFY